LVVEAICDELSGILNGFYVEILIGVKELAPPAVNLQKIFEQDTRASEPILIMISPGADPSQDLEELAKVTIGTEKYHQVS